ncbi:PTS N-acetylmuramic acid transporter subunit IIBC [Kosakonia radicincitans]|uniref:PTS N-acetylmuramic acid transporter subunit IIBC n=1 Tax=Kosakonia radicincitans TaxID=283686 RepID=UPI00046182AA|nr:PTS N-acetylmuramic acid transporter subunit IIBC [Kosakonia radicincitans]APG16387.1 PTS N-acetylmuramic acid transporter subunit IIBC [Kosakonia radicincitans]KDE37001.1 PTS system N-acetylmuramic acid transporter subunits IIBC [Kosakonia radicincitans UMEnt01/12]MDD7994833.1 PTS N-acetylmuramic acid transporter subunit IIBC [Kosakonia radicincitans]SKC05456.1 PTS system N-acetylmuramate-specific IIB component, Glc family /PTS system N-acetylmuramate-specific IIC component, Glc family [Kos
MAKISEHLIATIIEKVGGKENINTCGNCMTRLRLTLRDDSRVETESLKALPGVLGVVNSDDQLQIIVGPGKAQTAAEMLNAMIGGHAAPVEAASLKSIASDTKQQMKAKQTSGVHQFLAKFATIFTPLIPGFIAAGMLLGFATLIEQSLLLNAAEKNTAVAHLVGYMKVFGKGLFTFLPILIGYNAQKAFGGSGVNGAIIAALFVLGYDPKATVGYFSGIDNFFGMGIDPRGNIIGVLLAAILGAWIERQIRKVVPDNLDMILTSLLTLLITGALAFVVIMPIGGELFKGMSWLFLHLNGNPFGCAVLAGLFLIAVVFGVHQGFIPVYFALMDAQGFNSLFPILAMAGGGQVGAALALYFRSAPHSVLRNQVRGAIIPGLLGVGEPLIYAVTLPRVKPFVTACIGGACGGFFIGTVAWLGLPVGLNTVFGPSGLVALPLMTSGQGIYAGMAVYAAGVVIAYLCGFIATWLFGHKNVDLS